MAECEELQRYLRLPSVGVRTPDEDDGLTKYADGFAFDLGDETIWECDSFGKLNLAIPEGMRPVLMMLDVHGDDWRFVHLCGRIMDLLVEEYAGGEPGGVEAISPKGRADLLVVCVKKAGDGAAD